mmetsp:Transcript_77560/g.215522  ORF Transcript_77560/g.215522 Transcript_77560/m.215522 type:complete len:214 (-) Transcript_77560:146-787(-)
MVFRAILACGPVPVSVVRGDHVMLLEAALPHAHRGPLLGAATHEARSLRHDLLDVLTHRDGLVDERAILHLEERHRPMGVHVQDGLAPVLQVRQIDEALEAADCRVGNALLAEEDLHHQRVGSRREGVVVRDPWHELACVRGGRCQPSATPDEGHAVADRQHNLLKVRIVAHPLVEFADCVPEAATLGLCIEVLVGVRVTVVQDVVTNDHAGW